MMSGKIRKMTTTTGRLSERSGLPAQSLEISFPRKISQLGMKILDRRALHPRKIKIGRVKNHQHNLQFLTIKTTLFCRKSLLNWREKPELILWTKFNKLEQLSNR